jgi:hypothetical protein
LWLQTAVSGSKQQQKKPPPPTPPPTHQQQQQQQQQYKQPHTLPGLVRLPIEPGDRCASDTPCEAGRPLKPQRFITPAARARHGTASLI